MALKNALNWCMLRRCYASLNACKVSFSTSASFTNDDRTNVYKFPESVPPTPSVIKPRELKHLHPITKPKQAWLETLATAEDCKLGLVNLHPDVFGVYPRLDMLYDNVKWQRMYKHIDYAFARTRAEMPGGGRKPWPQKGTGRARQGSIRSPIWKGGGKAFGPRGPTSYFYMLDKERRAMGLRVALTVKYNQGHLHIVDSLDIPTDEDEYLRALIESRGWGLSALFINETDYLSKNFATAIDPIKEYNVMPLYGLNVYSMLKHETLILTLPALEKLEEKLLAQLHKADINIAFKRHST